jgi:transcription-repair coupling factor (superfamily II helicase)
MCLQAIDELHELAFGFDVANRDLEIRGAGRAAKVGFDLFTRMLKESNRRLHGLDLPIVPCRAPTNILLPTEGSPTTFRFLDSFIQDTQE